MLYFLVLTPTIYESSLPTPYQIMQVIWETKLPKMTYLSFKMVMIIDSLSRQKTVKFPILTWGLRVTFFFDEDQTKPAVVMACPRPDNFLKRYIRNVSGFSFIDDYTIVARNYLYVKVWDFRYPVAPKIRFSVNPSVNDRICNLYENGHLADQFSINVN
jgi:hypothetical protein